MSVSTVRRALATDAELGAGRLNEIIDALNALIKGFNERFKGGLRGESVRIVAFKIHKSISTAPGYYEIRTFEGEFVGTPTSQLMEKDIGPLSDYPDAVGVNLLQVNGAGSDVAADTLLLGMIIGRCADDGNYPGQLIIAFAPAGGGIPLGQYQGMFPQMVTDLQVGYDFLISHAMESI